MRVLHFEDTYNDTIETFIKQFVNKSRGFGYANVLALKNASQAEVKILRPIHHKRRTLAGLAYYLQDLIRPLKCWEYDLLKEIELFAPDIIHVHFGTTGVLLNSLLGAGKISKPVVISFYGYDISSLPVESESYCQALKELVSYRQLSFFCEGPALREKLQSFGASPDAIKVNPLLVQTKEIPIATLKRSREYINFLMVGRFVEKKGFHLALEAFGQIRDELPPFRIKIIGYGKLKSLYEKIIDEYVLQDHVTMLGKQDHHVVKEELSKADFFIHPSITAANGDSEGGAPTIIIEAQAAGIPVIASSHADIPFVMGYHDFLSTEGEIEDLKKHILKASRSQDLATLVDKGRRHVMAQHDFIESSTYESNLREIIDNFDQNI